MSEHENEKIRAPPEEKPAVIKGGIILPLNLGGALLKPLKPAKSDPASEKPVSAATPASMSAYYHSVQNSSADDNRKFYPFLFSIQKNSQNVGFWHGL